MELLDVNTWLRYPPISHYEIELSSYQKFVDKAAPYTKMILIGGPNVVLSTTGIEIQKRLWQNFPLSNTHTTLTVSRSTTRLRRSDIGLLVAGREQ